MYKANCLYKIIHSTLKKSRPAIANQYFDKCEITRVNAVPSKSKETYVVSLCSLTVAYCTFSFKLLKIIKRTHKDGWDFIVGTIVAKGIIQTEFQTVERFHGLQTSAPETARYCVVHQIRPALVTKSCGEDSVDGAVQVKKNNIHICSDVFC